MDVSHVTDFSENRLLNILTYGAHYHKDKFIHCKILSGDSLLLFTFHMIFGSIILNFDSHLHRHIWC